MTHPIFDIILALKALTQQSATSFYMSNAEDVFEGEGKDTRK